ncbi:hypothetical protein MOP88_16625 [Sphingomonas sp. WKB10]|nr:hypothetical protein [Sphingomonas sp. WKB10]
MIAFRALLIAAWTALAIYTGVVIARHGMDLLPIFFGDIARMTWSGQFNADFSCFLLLSALWTAWRHHFTPSASVSRSWRSSAAPDFCCRIFCYSASRREVT